MDLIWIDLSFNGEYSMLINYLENIFLCLITYADAIVDITPQLITFSQRTKSDMYQKNKHSSV
jgi:hypothetical protein